MSGKPRAEPKRVSFLVKCYTYLFVWPLLGLATAGFGCVSLLSGLWDKSGSQQHAIARAWANILLLISLSPVKLVGRENLRPAEVAVYASNHLSYYDTPVLFAAVGCCIVGHRPVLAIACHRDLLGIESGIIYQEQHYSHRARGR